METAQADITPFQEEPKTTGQKIKSLLGILTTVVAIPFAAVAIAFGYLGMQAIILVRTIFELIFSVIYAIIMAMVEQVLSIIGLFLVIGGAAYAIWEFNPEFRASVKNTLYEMDQLTQQYGNISLSNLPIIKDVMSAVEGRGYGDLTDPAALLRQLRPDNLPQELQPFLQALQSGGTNKTSDTGGLIEQFAPLLLSDDLKEEPEKAIPMLAKGLYSQDDNLRTAAWNALSVMKSDDAQDILEDYKAFVQETLGEIQKNTRR